MVRIYGTTRFNLIGHQYMKNYDSFAPYYDLAMGDRKDVAIEIRKLIKQFHPKARSLFELGCGSGSLLKVLARSYTTRGVDLSKEMIRVARKKVPSAKLEVADITNVRIDERFDVVLCAFDTINHITSFANWRRVFKTAKHHINPHGVFIFDINTERKLRRYQSEPPFAQSTKEIVSIFEVTQTSPSRFTVNVKVFKKKRRNEFALHEMNVYEAAYSVSKIIRELSEHFEQIAVVDLDRPEPTDESEELYFICSKPRVRRTSRSNLRTAIR